MTENQIDIKEIYVSPSSIKGVVNTTLIENDEKINILEEMDNETNIVYKIFDFLKLQDIIKEDITRYQILSLKEKSYITEDYRTILIYHLNQLINLIKSISTSNFSKYIHEFENFENNNDIINLNTNLQKIHAEVVEILHYYGIKEKLIVNNQGYDRSNIVIYEIGNIKLLNVHEKLPNYIEEFISEFNKISKYKGSNALIFYDRIDEMYRIDIYLGGTSSHRAIIKVYKTKFKLIYADACYTRLLALEKTLKEDYAYYNDSYDYELDLSIKDLEPTLINVTWKQAILYFTSPNELLPEMSNIIRLINWDYIVNPNNKEMTNTLESEVNLIYEGAFRTDVKCHRPIIHLFSHYRM